MMNCRFYGSEPYRVAVIHGGPGAAGEMAPVARTLAGTGSGVLEPLQTADTIAGQIDELASVVHDHGRLPVILAGHSWGAWLACLTAAAHPGMVGKLILIGSGPFEASYAAGIHETRMARLSADEREEAQQLMRILSAHDGDPPADVLGRFGELMSGADSYDSLPPKSVSDVDRMSFRPEIFRGVWPEADRMRQSGELLERVANVTCPVVAIHGDYDPHPAEGIREPLDRVLHDFRVILLDHCGHTPWMERQARERFYAILDHELAV